MRDNAEQSRLMANEATSRAKLYHEMARQSRAMAEYAEQAAEDSLAIRARTVADNMDLTMADLKEGLMSGLRALPETNRTEGLSSWTSSNNWVDQCFVWGPRKACPFPWAKTAGLPPLQEQEDWQREWLARNPTFWFQSDNETQRAKDESNLSGSAGSPDGNASPSEQNELSQSVSQSQTLEQQEALEVLKSQQMNSSALLSNILKNRQSKGKLQELEETQKPKKRIMAKPNPFSARTCRSLSKVPSPGLPKTITPPTS